MKYKTLESRTNIYFVSSVIAGHRNLFTDEDIARIPLESLSWFREKQLLRLFAFCLMPNHIHFIVQLVRGSKIENILARFHSYTGHQILSQLQKKDDKESLNFLFAMAARKKNDRKHLIWEDCLVKIADDESSLFEFIEYVHNNPINKMWRQVYERSSYRYSSACFYDKDIDPVIPIDDVRTLL